MPLVEILDGPREWAGAVFESPEDMVADEIGLSHPRWRGTPVGVRRGALYAYRRVEVAGDRHRYRYQGPWPQWSYRHRLGDNLTGWDVLVVQQELHSHDPRKLWAARSGCTRPRPVPRARTRPGRPRSRAGGSWTRAPGCVVPALPARAPSSRSGWPAGWPGEPVGGRALAAAGRPARCGQGRRGRSDRAGAGADALRGQGGQGAAAAATRGGGLLDQRSAVFRQDDVYIPMIGAGLATIRGLGNREWMALQDRVLLVVHPDLRLDDENGPLYGFARVYSAPPATAPPDPVVAPEQQGWAELEEGDFLLPWLLHITRYEL